MRILVTGGSRGIGRAIVKLFTKKGHQVAFTYVNAKKQAQTLAKETGAFPFCADSRNREECLTAVTEATKALGGIDVLVNNAGISAYSLVTDVTEEDLQELININLTAPFYYAQAVLPQMIAKQRGNIINIASMWGEIGASCEVAYAMTKAGLIGFTKALAKEVGPSGIRVNAVSPGFIATEMTENFSSETTDTFIEETPLCRLGTPEDVASAVIFLAENTSSFITGQILGVNGGYVV